METPLTRSDYVLANILYNSREISRPIEKCCIYRISPSLRENNEHSFTPRMVSIGPFHHGNDKLQEMEKQKHYYFNCFYKCLLFDYEKTKLREFSAMLEEHEKNIRDFYSEEFTVFDSTKFVHMMLLDSVFIMEALLKKENPPRVKDDDYYLHNDMTSTVIAHDLILLENQLPFYLLTSLFDHVVPADRAPGCHTFLELARNFFKSYDPHFGESEQQLSAKELLKSNWNAPLHFTDLIRSLNVSVDLSNDTGPLTTSALKTARKLKEAGVLFNPVSDRCLLDIRFEKQRRACLKIPTLVFNRWTESLFLNMMMAFEICHYSDHLYVLLRIFDVIPCSN